MASIPKNKHTSRLFFVIATLTIAFLAIVAGIIFWTHSDKLTRETKATPSISTAPEYTKPGDWLTYTDQDVPFTFDHPKSIVFEKKTNSLNFSKSETKSGYTRYTFLGLIDGHKDQSIAVQYTDGADPLSDHDNECFPQQNRQHIKVTNDFSPEEMILICEERKLWELDYKEKGSKELQVISDTDIDLASFTKIVQSLRRASN